MTPWFKIYRDLALLLRDFYSVYNDRSGIRLYELCMENSIFPLTNQWVLRFDKVNINHGFDPMHIFASISDPKLKTETRINRIRLLFEILDSSTRFFDIDFDGCPTPFTIKIMSTRSQETQTEIWAFFAAIVDNKGGDLKQLQFPDYENWYGINLASLTILMFWIDHRNYLPLDSNTQNYLKTQLVIAKIPKNLKEYSLMLKTLKETDYLAISIKAAASRTMKLRPIRYERIIEAKPRKPAPSQAAPLQQSYSEETSMPLSACRMIGLRVYEPTPDKWVKVLQRGKIYTFYKAFSFDNRHLCYHQDNDSTIAYDEFKDVNLFDLQGKKVNVSAIAGENGSGKSTLIDLFFLAINNLTARDRQLGDDLTYVDGLCLDFYFMTDSLYKLTINLGSVQVFRYHQNGQEFNNPTTVSVLGFELEQLFYTIAINHSLYALNSKQMGEWIVSLIEKNDQYQIPVVINPYRREGNININTENQLVRSRLMATLLQPITESDDPERKTLRHLTADRLAEKLALKLDAEMFTKTTRHRKAEIDFSFELTNPYWKPLLQEVCSQFNITVPFPDAPPSFPDDFKQAAFLYLVKKIITICLNYPLFEDFVEPARYQIKPDSIIDLVNALETDKTHVTHKLYQTIHFLKHPHLENIREEADIDTVFETEITQTAFEIDRLRSEISDNRLRVTHFIPPPFLSVEILLNNNIPLAELSSGEKQRIFSVSSLAYHLINLDSNMDSQMLRHYTSINVVFDEIELYFHPEMQRSFIKFLLDYLEVVELETEFDINILFITHSPFILSDIPSDNILFLGNRVPPGIKTFGSNIHTLLAESFFLKDSFMGDFARGKINELINFLIDENSGVQLDENSAAKMINLIGEPLIRERLTEIYQEKYHGDQSTNVQINALQNQIKILQNEKD